LPKDYKLCIIRSFYSNYNHDYMCSGRFVSLIELTYIVQHVIYHLCGLLWFSFLLKLTLAFVLFSRTLILCHVWIHLKHDLPIKGVYISWSPIFPSSTKYVFVIQQLSNHLEYSSNFWKVKCNLIDVSIQFSLSIWQGKYVSTKDQF
jgi:hypothetical protein